MGSAPKLRGICAAVKGARQRDGRVAVSSRPKGKAEQRVTNQKGMRGAKALDGRQERWRRVEGETRQDETRLIRAGQLPEEAQCAGERRRRRWWW
jgi:hypothetical protein